MTGPDASKVNGSFVPATVEFFPSNSQSGTPSVLWRASDIGYVISFGPTVDDNVDAVAITFATGSGNTFEPYHYHGECFVGEPLADCSVINLNIANKTIQFNNFSLPVFAPSEAGNVATAPLILNGTLSW